MICGLGERRGAMGNSVGKEEARKCAAKLQQWWRSNTRMYARKDHEIERHPGDQVRSENSRGLRAAQVSCTRQRYCARTYSFWNGFRMRTREGNARKGLGDRQRSLKPSAGISGDICHADRWKSKEHSSCSEAQDSHIKR